MEAGKLCTDPNPGLCFGAREGRAIPTTPLSRHTPCTPSPAMIAAWVARASQGLPGGSPVMTLITQVSGSTGVGRAPGAAFTWHPASPPQALPHPL